MKKSVRIILHTLFWVLFPLVNAFSKWANAHDVIPGFESLPKLGFFQILYKQFQSLLIPIDAGPLGTPNIFGIFFNFFIYIIIPVGVFYFFYSLLIPKTIKATNSKNLIIPILFILICPLLIVVFFKYFTISVALKFTYCVTLVYILTIIFAILGSLFRILENWVIAEKLSKQNLQSELALLKYQINPHFLFNTLNNIDSLIRSNAEKASTTLVKLSEILRYMIYDTNFEKVPLSNEIKHIESFIDLQKMQFSNKELAIFTIIGNPDNILIAPMLFIPFIENAFKHCTDKNIPNAIRINLSVVSNQVNFESLNVYDKTQNITKDETKGIGLNSVKRRLEIIYPNKYTLSIKEEDNTFKVKLSVNTNEN